MQKGGKIVFIMQDHESNHGQESLLTPLETSSISMGLGFSYCKGTRSKEQALGRDLPVPHFSPRLGFLIHKNGANLRGVQFIQDFLRGKNKVTAQLFKKTFAERKKAVNRSNQSGQDPLCPGRPGRAGGRGLEWEGLHSQQLQLVLPTDERVLLVDQREPLLDQHLLLQPVGT